jgi:hypothetical protein
MPHGRAVLSMQTNTYATAATLQEESFRRRFLLAISTGSLHSTINPPPYPLNKATVGPAASNYNQFGLKILFATVSDFSSAPIALGPLK